MAEPFLAEIKLVGFTFAPRGFANCDGQLLPINQNQALYSLLGTTYGGDGQTTFALPDLRGRTPVHPGSIIHGQKGGEETHQLTIQEMPRHRHEVFCSTNNAPSTVPDDRLPAVSGVPAYRAPSGSIEMHPMTVTDHFGGQAHENMAPFLVIRFVIALQGTFPPRN